MQKITINQGRAFAWTVVVLAFALRFLLLRWKLAHFDEGINGWFVQKMWREGFFRYDPSNFHGPLHFYLMQLAEVLGGHGVVAMRAMTGLVSLAGLWVLWRLREFFSGGAWVAAFVCAVSPAMVFYSRYAIHESLFILGQLTFFFGFCRWRAGQVVSGRRWIVAGLVILLTTKETFVLFLAAWMGACLIAQGGNLLKQNWVQLRRRLRDELVDGWQEWLLGVVAIAVLFSGGMQFPEGILDFFRAFMFWTKTGVSSSGHEKPVWYWLRLMWIYEWPILIGLMLLPVVWQARTYLARWLVAFALLHLLLYSLIPYKTPWLVLNMIWPLALALGLALNLRKRLRWWLGWGLSLAVSLVICLRLNFVRYTESDEPYVYVQSKQDLNALVDALNARAEQHPEDWNMLIQVLVKDPWPLPYVLSPFTRVEYLGAIEMPTAQNLRGPASVTKPLGSPDVVILDAAEADKFEKVRTQAYYRQTFQLRDAYAAGFVYYSAEKFSHLVNGVLLLAPSN